MQTAPTQGRVATSSSVSQRIACGASGPHISADGCRPPQKAGRSGRPKMRQRLSSSSWTQRTPAGFPCGMPGMGLAMDGAMQQAPQPGRQASSGEGGAAGMGGLSVQMPSRVARAGAGA